MVDTQLLDEKIYSSGIKVGHITNKIGISRQAFDRKKKNMLKFRVSEVYVLCDLLKLTDAEKERIFFASEVEK